MRRECEKEREKNPTNLRAKQLLRFFSICFFFVARLKKVNQIGKCIKKVRRACGTLCVLGVYMYVCVCIIHGANNSQHTIYRCSQFVLAPRAGSATSTRRQLWNIYMKFDGSKQRRRLELKMADTHTHTLIICSTNCNWNGKEGNDMGHLQALSELFDKLISPKRQTFQSLGTPPPPPFRPPQSLLCNYLTKFAFVRKHN